MLIVKQITVTESQQMGALLITVEEMASLIDHCQIYEALYLKRKQFRQREWKQAVRNLTSAFMTIYTTMLEFLGSVVHGYGHGGIIQRLQPILNPTKMFCFLDKCQSLTNDLTIELDNCERVVSTRQIQSHPEEHVQKLKQILAGLQMPISRIKSLVAASCTQLADSERVSILQWVSDIDYIENHRFACQWPTAGTGGWFLRHERYHEWHESTISLILWLHGSRKYYCVLILN